MKTIPIALRNHKAQNSTTLTELCKVGPLPDGTFRGFSALDRDVEYNDGDGLLTYIARTGLQMSAIVATADLGVDNAEAQNLYPLASYPLEGFTQTEIDAGVLDKTPFVVYLVNYEDLSMGHEVRGSGTIGEQKVKNGQVTVLELRSLSQQFKQTIGELDSLTCRAKFGSQSVQNSNGDAVIERFPCGYDLDAEWVNATVTSVGAETDREFVAASLNQTNDYFAPGVVQWLTGDNAGQVREVEVFGYSSVDLQFPTSNPISIGDTFRIRRDCTKRHTGHNSCQTFFASNWVLHFRGEPHIPVADTGNINSPGAGISSTGTGGTGEELE